MESGLEVARLAVTTTPPHNHEKNQKDYQAVEPFHDLPPGFGGVPDMAVLNSITWIAKLLQGGKTISGSTTFLGNTVGPSVTDAVQ